MYTCRAIDTLGPNMESNVTVATRTEGMDQVVSVMSGVLEIILERLCVVESGPIRSSALE